MKQISNNKFLNFLKSVSLSILKFIVAIGLYVGAIGVGLFLCYIVVMKFGSTINDTSMLQEARTTNIYDSIRRQSRAEDKKLAKEIYEVRIANGYYNKGNK